MFKFKTLSKANERIGFIAEALRAHNIDLDSALESEDPQAALSAAFAPLDDAAELKQGLKSAGVKLSDGPITAQAVASAIRTRSSITAGEQLAEHGLGPLDLVEQDVSPDATKPGNLSTAASASGGDPYADRASKIRIRR